MFVNETTVGGVSLGVQVVPTVFVSTSAGAHETLLGLEPEQCSHLSLVAGNRPEYDLLLHRVPRHFTLEGLSSPQPSGCLGNERRFLVSLQSHCGPDEARLLNFIAQFVPVDVLGRCVELVTWNTRHARRLLDSGATRKLHREEVLKQYELVLILDASDIADRGAVDISVWESLAAGAVPIYWGARNFVEWLPDPSSGIDASAFSSPVHLAAYLQELRTEPSGLQHYHAWRSRFLPCPKHQQATTFFCRAMLAQAPDVLTWDGLTGLVHARLRQTNPSAQYFRGGGCGAASAEERAWRRSCADLLPASAAAVGTRVLGATSDTGRLRFHEVSGESVRGSSGEGGFRARGLYVEAEGEVLHLQWQGPGGGGDPSATLRVEAASEGLARQWGALKGLLSNREVFGNRTVLQLGLRSRDTLPFAGLAAWLYGGASDVIVHAPWRDLEAVANLAKHFASASASSPLRLAVQDDFRQSRGRHERAGGVPKSFTASLWLEAGANEFLQADVVLALGSGVPLALTCLGLRSMDQVAGLFHHLTREALVLEWPRIQESGFVAHGALSGCGVPSDLCDVYKREALIAALGAIFQYVTIIGDEGEGGGAYILCLGPRKEHNAWARIHIAEPPLPLFPPAAADGPAREELARSGFIWGGVALTKVILAQGRVVIKVTNSLLALKEAFFLDMFAPDFACVPQLLGHQHGHNSLENVGDLDWWSWVSMERVAGSSFEEHLSRSVETPEDVRQLLLAAIDLLGCLTNFSTQHNDLWAPNLFVQRGDEKTLRLVAIDFGAARLLLPGGQNEDDLEVEDITSDEGIPVQRASSFLRRAHIAATDLPQLVPNFFVDAGPDDVWSEAAVEPRSDQHMLGITLERHLLGPGVVPKLLSAATPWRHVVELIARGDGVWHLAAIRELLEGIST